MSAGPLPSRRVLAELRPTLAKSSLDATPIARALVFDLDAALAAHDQALARLDRAEAAFIAVQRSVWPDEAAGKVVPHHGAVGALSRRERFGRRLGSVRDERRRRRGVGSKRRSFIVRGARETRLARHVREVADCLLSMPTAGRGDVALKLAVIIAAGEAGPPDASAFPWVHLRRVLADLDVSSTTFL